MEGLRVLGKPAAFAEFYYGNSADEIAYIDTVASLYGRNNLAELLQRTTDSVFVPVAAGGGVRSVDDALRLLRHGADKVLLNTAAIKRPALIHEISDAMGCQSVMLYVEAKWRDWGWEAMTDNARECSGRSVPDWVQEAVSLGIGEVLLHSVDQDGTGEGYDLDLIRVVSRGLSAPMIASGGCGKPEHVVEAIHAGADAVAVAGYLHYGAMHQVAAQEGITEGNTEFMRGLRGTPAFGGTLQSVKDALKDAGYLIREVAHC